jgi:hypothetical protein
MAHSLMKKIQAHRVGSVQVTRNLLPSSAIAAGAGDRHAHAQLVYPVQ